jgi:ATP phosphoribosyltransferase regulatory subunit
MSKPFEFEKPIGMRDTLPRLYETKVRMRENVTDEIDRWGFRFVETPTLEYYDTVGSATAIPEQHLFKLLDQQGKMLVLRPDMTAPIARIAASTLKKEAFPLRLGYNANVFRAQQREGGRPAEFEQIGIELIGDGSSSADAEVIALMINVLRRTGLQNFQVGIGHVGYINAMFLEIVGNEGRAGQLRRYLFEKNYVGYRYYVKDSGLSSIDQKRLFRLLELRGGREKIEDASRLVENENGKKMLAELSRLWNILDNYGVSDYIKIDFTLVSHMNYYTGIVFEGYDEKVGFPLSGGGRYDELLGKFGRPAHATGFGIFFDRLLEAVEERKEQKKRCCVIFSAERLKEAVMLANEKRNGGECVVLQNVAGIADLDAFMKQFDDIVYCIGGAGKGAYE